MVSSAIVAPSSSTLVPNRNDERMRQSFAQWIIVNQISSSGICRYFRGGPHGHEESPLATAYAILYLAPIDLPVAKKLGNALLALQASYASNKFVSGAVPSISNDSSQLFYSSDALICAKALVQLWYHTKDNRYKVGAGRFLAFVERMIDGVSHNMMLANLDFPMQYATPHGDFQNFLVPNIGMLFWDALRDYSAIASEKKYEVMYDRGRTFLLNNVQAPNGAFYDHYDPGYPAKPYSLSQWKWFKVEKGNRPIAIGDNMLMSALGAQQMDGFNRSMVVFMPMLTLKTIHLDSKKGIRNILISSIPRCMRCCCSVLASLMSQHWRL
jgi:hypothetical protein